MDQANVPAAGPAPQPQPDSTLHFLDYWRIIRIRKTVILAVFLLVVITATLVTFILPKKYSASARLKIEGDVADVGLMGDRGSRGIDIYFLQTEFELMQSDIILETVVTNLNLNEKWSKGMEGNILKTQETLARLRNKLRIGLSRNSSLIKIEVVSEDSLEAAQLANDVAQTYRDYRKTSRASFAQGGIKELEMQIATQDKKITAEEAIVSALRGKLGITDMQLATVGDGTTLENLAVRTISQQLLELQPIYTKEMSLYRELTNMPPEQLRYSILTAVQPDPVLQSALQELLLAQSKLISLENDLGPRSSEVMNIKKQIEHLEHKVQSGVQGIMGALHAKLEADSQQLASLEKKMELAKAEDLAKAAAASEYFTAKRNFDYLHKFREALSLKLAQERVDYAIPKTSMVTITDHAVANPRPVSPNKPLHILIGVVVGLVVGVGLAFFIEYLDTSVKTIDEVERALQAPVLGVIPQNVGYLLKEGAESAHAEAYRVLRTNLLFSRKDEKLTSIVVVSAGAGEGKSTTVFNLATIFAMHGSRVILVDSDLRRPTIHKILGVSNSLGLTNYLLKQNTLEEVIQTSSLPTFDVLPSGKLPSSSMGILNSKAMRDLIAELKQRYDFVFFDSPPMVGLSDASILCSEMDLTIQVIQYRRYPQPMTIRAKQMIDKVGGRVGGIVLNNINMSQDEYYYYYSGYYGGYYGDYYSKNENEAGAEDSGPDKKKGSVEIKQKY